MRKLLFLLTILTVSFSVAAQQDEVQRLQDLLKSHPQEDTFRVNRLLEIVDPLTRNDKEEADKYSDEAIAIAIKIGYSDGEAYAMLAKSRIKSLTGKTAEGMALVKKADSIAKKSGDNHMKTMVLLRYSNVHSNLSSTDAITYGLSADSLAAIVNDNQLSIRVKINMAELMYVTSDYAKALQYANEMLKILEKYDCQPCLVTAWNTFSNVYIALGQYDKSTAYLNKIMELNKKTGGTSAPNASMSNSIGENYRLSGKYAEAMTYYRQALNTTKDAYLTETAESNMADVYVHMDSLPLAFEYAFRAMEGCIKLEDLVGIAWIDGILSRAYLKKNMTDSALYHAKHGLETARQIGVVEYLRDNAKALADAYVVKKNYEQAYQYQNLYINYRDSMINSEVKNKIAVLEYNTELEKKQGEISVLSQQKKAQQNFLIAVSVVLLSILITAIALLRNNQQKQRAYAKLEAAQAQLVQSEKMASLGELTAGIAHEIQNPLNFVNNFSEVNNELIEEVKIHNNKVKNQNYPEIDELLSDIFSNNEKIAHHGRRADSIVKGMLQHSRNSTGHKELSDINNIADEYLRLSYHGYRAKEKAFNATLKTDFDNSIGKITIIPQDIGRVLLNLFNNAFYAVNEKANRKVNGYEPAVSLSTKKTSHKIEIKVSDNGNGIPQAVVEKIFQPFFTTKPAGEGTGLGLSLAYDIVTKGHGGEMKVETKEGEGTTFTIMIPV